VPEPIEWLWPSWLARGKLILLAGVANAGKTTIALDLAATLTRAGYWPDRLPCRDAGRVLIWSGEDDAADTLVPRLIAAKADLTRIHFIHGIDDKGRLRAFDPSTDMPLLEAKAKDIGGVDLLIIDPVVSAVAGDMHKANDVRRDLQSLVDFAAANRCALLGITHFAKNSQGSLPQDRVIGSQAFVALARMVLSAAQREDGNGCVLVRTKSNISQNNDGIAYAIKTVEVLAGRGAIGTTRVEWGEAIEGGAREILGAFESGNSKGKTQFEEAMALLPKVLTERMPGAEAIAVMKKNGIGEKATRAAFDTLGGERIREGYGAETVSLWKLPSRFILLPEESPAAPSAELPEALPAVSPDDLSRPWAEDDEGQGWTDAIEL
jgi:RecA-family ATPase